MVNVLRLIMAEADSPSVARFGDRSIYENSSGASCLLLEAKGR